MHPTKLGALLDQSDPLWPGITKERLGIRVTQSHLCPLRVPADEEQRLQREVEDVFLVPVHLELQQ